MNTDAKPTPATVIGDDWLKTVMADLNAWAVKEKRLAVINAGGRQRRRVSGQRALTAGCPKLLVRAKKRLARFARHRQMSAAQPPAQGAAQPDFDQRP